MRLSPLSLSVGSETLELLAEVPNAHIGYVYSVHFSPDGSKIVSGSGDNSIKLWGVLLPACKLHRAVQCRWVGVLV